MTTRGPYIEHLSKEEVLLFPVLAATNAGFTQLQLLDRAIAMEALSPRIAARLG
jgi:hypothetical protein